MVSGTEALKTWAAFKVTVPVLITTPPVAANGVIHSKPVVCVVLYCNVALAPYVGAAETVPVPSMDKIEGKY